MQIRLFLQAVIFFKLSIESLLFRFKTTMYTSQRPNLVVLQQGHRSANNERHQTHDTAQASCQRCCVVLAGHGLGIGTNVRLASGDGVNVGKAQISRVEAVCLVDLADLWVAGFSKDYIDTLEKNKRVSNRFIHFLLPVSRFRWKVRHTVYKAAPCCAASTT